MKPLRSCVIALLGLSLTTLADEAAIGTGKAVYMGKGACFTCHGAAGKGDGAAAAALNPKPRSFEAAEFMYDTDGDGQKGTDTDLTNIIKNGAMKYGGSPLMAGRPDLTDDEVKGLIAFVRSLKSEG